jgi:glutaredoxin-like protein
MASNTNSEQPELEYFWRPGCPFCANLERQLASAGIEPVRRNIWDDPDAAEIVRSVADGNETVPTVRYGDQALVNPSLQQVEQLLATG